MAMHITIDVSNPFQKRPGYRKGHGGYITGWRCWWLWFAISYLPVSEIEYHNRVSSGITIWVADE